ncbi:MAG: hypothetical protein ACI857_002557 [Arenicella sp.]|jgi:hypothetical protein
MHNPAKNILKLIWHWFKLILAISFVGGPIGMIADTHKEVDSTEKLVMITVIISIFVIIGLLFLKSFVKNQRKNDKAATPLFWQSKFYAEHPKFSQLLLKGRLNGTGSAAYTSHNKLVDESYERIVWLSVAFIPITPLIQQRVTPEEKDKKWRLPLVLSIEKSSVIEIEKTKLNRRLVAYTYIFYYGFILPSIIAPLILFINFREELSQAFPGPNFWWLILTYLIFGILLMFVAEMFNRKSFLKHSYKRELDK